MTAYIIEFCVYFHPVGETSRKCIVHVEKDYEHMQWFIAITMNQNPNLQAYAMPAEMEKTVQHF